MGRGIVAPIPRPIARSHEADPDAYVTSGAYERDLAAICTDALDRVHQYLAHARPTQRKLVAIFDIDETLLSSHREIVRQANLSYLARGARMPQGYLPPLRSVVDLLHALQRLGFAIVILTGRRSTTEGVTVANLQWVGVNGWDHIIFRQTGTPEENMLAVEYKSKQRERVDGAGYAIVLNIGDQRSDIEGSCPGAIRVKVPHHYYLP
ncbi:MAG TPA: HAD family acid phosphatase [Rariglobus sp.]